MSALPSPLQGKTVIIVGGTTGIGLSAAKALQAAGANLIITGRSPESLDRALSELGENAIGIPGDASDPQTSPDFIARTVAQFGDLHSLYHVAGGSGRSKGDGPLHELTNEGIDFTINLNLKSLIYSNRAAVQQFRKQGNGGVILNMSSVLGFSSSPKYFATHAYAATKAAAIGFTKSIASYYAADNIRANVIAPALVETPMSERASQDNEILNFIKTKQPLDGGRNGRPDDLDAAALYLLSDDSRFVTGQVLAVDGGWSVSEGQY
jgi:NAD(P)-dependent dehydrogenase (short-subunit alcohol dehydrogenase family)